MAQYLIGVMEQLAARDFLAQRLKAGCFNGNTGAMLLYARLGYQVEGVVERQHPNGERVALVQFVKQLQS